MNKLVFLSFLFFTSFLVKGQISPSSVPLDVPWTVSFGVNFVDNDGFRFDKPFSTSNWNFKNPIYFSVQRKWHPHWAAGLALSVNSLQEKNLQNGFTLTNDLTLFSMDGSVNWIYDHLFMDTPNIDPFEAYIISGFGFTSVSTHDTMTFNLGLGFNFWIIQDIGIRLQTMGKWGREYQYLKNYLQHSIEFIVRF